MEPLFEPTARGAPPRYAKRSLVEAIFLVLREGRPPGYPPRKLILPPEPPEGGGRAP
ncbi:transposase, partial [Meiothermus hypogaeus]|uniref:transposase n=1 Tax=Meiothermus hypogaeus TaxID=884155 RepID=UPI003530F647